MENGTKEGPIILICLRRGKEFYAECHLRFKSGQVLRDLRFKTGHPPEVLGFEGLNVNKLLFMPKS